MLRKQSKRERLGARVLGDSLGALGHGVLGELAGKHEADGGLDLSGREGGLGVVLAKAAGLRCDALEHVVDERVHDRHGFLGDTSVGVHLLEDTVDVGGVGLLALGAALAGGALLASLLRGFLAGCFGHFVVWCLCLCVCCCCCCYC